MISVSTSVLVRIDEQANRRKKKYITKFFKSIRIMLKFINTLPAVFILFDQFFDFLFPDPDLGILLDID